MAAPPKRPLPARPRSPLLVGSSGLPSRCCWRWQLPLSPVPGRGGCASVHIPAAGTTHGVTPCIPSQGAVGGSSDNLGGVLRMLTAGESHGPALTVVVDGLPAG